MVFDANVKIEGDGQRRIRGAVVEYFEDLSRLLSFRVVGFGYRGIPIYELYFDLFMPNYASVSPSVAIKGSYFVLESAYLLNKVFGAVAPYYNVNLGQQGVTIIVCEVYARTEYTSLDYRNFIIRTPLFVPPPFSSLL